MIKIKYSLFKDGDFLGYKFNFWLEFLLLLVFLVGVKMVMLVFDVFCFFFVFVCWVVIWLKLLIVLFRFCVFCCFDFLGIFILFEFKVGCLEFVSCVFLVEFDDFWKLLGIKFGKYMFLFRLFFFNFFK